MDDDAEDTMTTILTEKVRPVGFDTDTSPKGIEAGNEGNRAVINPVIDCLNKHYHTSENGMSMEIENIRGTTSKANSLPAGTNVCIGTYEDKLNNQLIFWNFNSNNNHGVYAYSPETDLITTLLQVNGLAFQNDRRYLVTGAGSIGQLLYWSDGINPQRVINMTRSYAYGTFSLTHISVIKPHPITRIRVGENDYYEAPQFDRTYDAAINTNRITDKNLQFSYRYKYLDNEYSVIAPYSTLSFADFISDKFNVSGYYLGYVYNLVQLYSYNNKIRIRITVPSTPNAFIKNVELLVRENNSGNWQTWKTVDGVSANIDTYFNGNESLTTLDQTETSKLFESVPNFSKALAVTKNRLFINSGEEGFNVNDFPTIAITEKVINATASTSTSTIVMLAGSQTFVDSGATTYVIGERIRLVLSSDATRSMTGIVTAISGSSITFYVDTITNGSIGSSWNIYKIIANNSPGAPADFYKTFFKTNGSYVFSIAVFDADQRCMGIISKTQYNVSVSGMTRVVAGGTIYKIRTGDFFVKAVISGSFSTSPKVKYYSLCVSKEQVYQQYCQCLVRPLFYRFDKSTGYSPSVDEFELESKIFVKNPTSASDFNQLYLQLPKEIPFVVDTTFFVRLLDKDGYTVSTNKVLQVKGDYIIVSDFGAPMAWVVLENLYVEIFQPKTVQDIFFYEITDRYSVDGSGVLSQPTIETIYGDQYRPALSEPYPYTTNLSGIDKSIQTFRTLVPLPPYFTTYDALPLYNNETPSPTTVTSSESLGIVIIDPTSSVGFSGGSEQPLIIPDYQKIAYNQGKAIVEVPDKKALPRTSVIRFSNKYVQDTNVNGMSSFDVGNQYTLAYDRGPIVKLQPIANRMLAIHERATTVLYLNEKMIKTAEGAEQLIATGDTIGYDSQLEGNFGCYHPESIVKVEDDVNAVFGFDIYKGVVWRYTLEGQYPISNYGRKQYFRDKANTYISNKNGVKIIGGHDPFHKEYLITFNDGTGASETIAFNYVKKVWTTRYSFIPEYYGKINNKLISFKAGALWVHNDSNTYNNFYGQQYPSFIEMAVNPHPTRIKVGIGIDLSIENLSTTTDFLQVEFFTDEGQQSYLKTDEFDKKENVFYANILRDLNTDPFLLLKIDFPYTIWDNTTNYHPGDVVFYIPSSTFYNCTVANNNIIPNTFFGSFYWSNRFVDGLLALRDGNEIRSRYFKVKINDDSTTRNLIQQLNLQYVMSEYSQ